jgi:GPH family glycoside/pentoside/hexuronide:cation symporter
LKETPSLAVKIGFGSGQLAGQIFRDTPSLLLLFYLTTVVRIEPALAGAAIFFPKVFWGVTSDLTVGLTSDRLNARFPRRNWLLVGAVLAPGAMVLLFHVPDTALATRLAYVVVAFAFYMIAFSTFSVPYLAQFSEITSDPEQRAEAMDQASGQGGAAPQRHADDDQPSA